MTDRLGDPPGQELPPFLLETDASITTLTFQRPERANSFTRAMWVEFVDVLQRADRDPNSTAIVITGAGRHFCTGGDIDAMAAHGEPDVRVRHSGLDLVDAMLTLEKPVVAAVDGAAVGLGATVALLCDRIVMSERASLSDTHVPLGIVAGDGAVVALMALVGPHRTKELLLSGRRVASAEAVRLGLASERVPVADLQHVARRTAAAMAKGPAYAVRATKLVVNHRLRLMAAGSLDLAFAYEAISRALPDHHDALSEARRERADRQAGPALPSVT